MLQFSPFTQRKHRLWTWPTVACDGSFMVGGLHVKNHLCLKPLKVLALLCFKHSFYCTKSKNKLLVFICSICHVSPCCGYCKSSLEATSTRGHRNKKKITATAESLFIDCLFLLLLCTQNWYSPHFSRSRHKETSHTSSSPECCLWAASLSCPHNFLISSHRAIS